MKKNLIFLIITFALSTVFFLSISNLYSFIAYPYLILLLGPSGIDILSNTSLIISSLSIITLLFAANIWQLLTRRFSKLFLVVQSIAYCILLTIVIMFKSIGVQAINLNPLSILTQFGEGAFIVLANIVLFIPIGFILFSFVKPIKKAIIYSFLGLLCLEITQYILHLGVADISDLFTNLAGIGLGYLALDILTDMGWKSYPDGQWTCFKK